jgi:guanylate kinase
MKRGMIFVFSAASGAGKNTLIDHIRRTVPNMVYSISATTRPPRPGEIDGKHYFFLSEAEFKRRIEAGAFAEWARVHDHYYGTPKDFIDGVIASGRHIIMDIDVKGKKMFDRVYPQAIGILVVPPSMEELERRLRARRSDDEATIKLRLTNAKEEMDFARQKGKYEYTIVNDDLDRAKQEIETLITSLISA